MIVVMAVAVGAAFLIYAFALMDGLVQKRRAVELVNGRRPDGAFGKIGVVLVGGAALAILMYFSGNHTGGAASYDDDGCYGSMRC